MLRAFRRFGKPFSCPEDDNGKSKPRFKPPAVKPKVYYRKMLIDRNLKCVNFKNE
jgi:hypothetical protein